MPCQFCFGVSAMCKFELAKRLAGRAGSILPRAISEESSSLPSCMRDGVPKTVRFIASVEGLSRGRRPASGAGVS
jgi:hypothetical protein